MRAASTFIITDQIRQSIHLCLLRVLPEHLQQQSQGLWYRFDGLGFRVYGLDFRVEGWRFRVFGLPVI